MANGDTVKFGMLRATRFDGTVENLRGVTTDNAPYWVDSWISPSGPDTISNKYRTFTFVENNTGDDTYSIEWIEDTFNGKKVYTSKNALFLYMGFLPYLRNINQKVNINNKTYLVKGIKACNLVGSTNQDDYRIPVEKLNLIGVHNSYICTIDKSETSGAIGYGFYPGGGYIQSYYDTDCDGEEGHRNYGTYVYLIEANDAPVISGEDSNLGNKTSNFSITYSVNDNDVADELTVNEKLNGDIIRTLKNPVKGNKLTLTISEERFASLSMNTTNTIEIEVTDGSATSYRRYTFVKTNSAPLINYSGQSDLGQLTSKPTITYSVSDNEGDTITVTEKLNGEVIREFTATSNTNYTITLTDEFWLTCGKNTNTIEISASDVNGGTSYKYITFTRQINKVQITTKNPIETDAAATKIMVSPDWDKTGCTGKVEVCNNGFDASPTWEDMTTMAALNRPYVFTNTTKTATKWGIKIRLTLTKNEGYEGEVAIYGFGGAFE